MESSFLQSLWTVIAFVFFIAVVVWAWSGRRKKDFDKAARMALDDEETVSEDQLRK